MCVVCVVCVVCADVRHVRGVCRVRGVRGELTHSTAFLNSAAGGLQRRAREAMPSQGRFGPPGRCPSPARRAAARLPPRPLPPSSLPGAPTPAPTAKASACGATAATGSPAPRTPSASGGGRCALSNELQQSTAGVLPPSVSPADDSRREPGRKASGMQPRRESEAVYNAC